MEKTFFKLSAQSFISISGGSLALIFLLIDVLVFKEKPDVFTIIMFVFLTMLSVFNLVSDKYKVNDYGIYETNGKMIKFSEIENTNLTKYGFFVKLKNGETEKINSFKNKEMNEFILKKMKA